MSTLADRQLNLKVRVRPQRIAVVLPTTLPKWQFREVVAFLSVIWGGRYCAIIPASRRQPERVRRRLQSVCPEIVIAVGLNDEYWQPIVRDACQPRVYREFPSDWRELIAPTSDLDLILSYAVVNPIAKDVAHAEFTNIRLPPVQVPKSYKLLCDIVFGIPENDAMPWIRDSLKAVSVNSLGRPPFAGFGRICTELGNRFTWIDLAATGLDRRHYSGDGLAWPPTILVVENSVADLALYWSVRMGRGSGASLSLLPIPRSEIYRKESIEAVADWVQCTDINSNYCVVTSDSAPSPATNELARRLKQKLRGTRYRFIDVEPESALWPTIVPSEKRQDEFLQADLQDGVLSCELPTPAIEDRTRPSGAWMVDVVSDVGRRRALGDLALPHDPLFADVLQAQTPPNVSFGGLPLAGITIEGVSFRVSKRDRRIRYQLPTAEELLGAKLIQSGLKLKHDEKQLRYQAAMDLCGGLHKTCITLTGTPGAILNILKVKPRPEGEIGTRLANASKGHESHQFYMDRVGRMLRNMPRPAREVSRRRFEEHSGEVIHSGDPVGDVLHKLAQRRIIEPRIRLRKCKLCHDRTWLPGLDLTKPVLCPGCHVPRPLSGKPDIGYTLNPLMSVAMDEGIRPVMFTARFLSNASTIGFLWLPGCKGNSDMGDFDFDIIALCDGRMVVAECKDLGSDQTPIEVWDEIAEQFERTIDFGARCGADIAAFACTATEVSKRFIRRVNAYTSNRMRIIYLNRGELETGRRTIRDPRGGERWAWISDFVRDTKSPKRRKRAPRTISIGTSGRVARD